ncbi:hypothetical protein [Peribacillus sp. SCS-155]|uniref:hypothetical protein n=1 Tax=Peribacillus sedimenti TaxID=3115297 RepID=UPI003905E8D3
MSIKGKLQSYATERDVVSISEKVNMKEISDWFRENKQKLLAQPYVISKGSLLFQQEGQISYNTRLCFDLSHGTHQFYEVYNVKIGTTAEELIAQYKLENNPDDGAQQKIQLIYPKDINKGQATAYLTELLDIFHPMLSFVTRFQDSSNIDILKNQLTKVKHRKKHKSVVRKSRTTYYVTDTVVLKEAVQQSTAKQKKAEPSNTYTRKGHWRTIKYKDGSTKKIWIEPKVIERNIK